MTKGDKKKPEIHAAVVGNADDLQQAANTLERVGERADATADGIVGYWREDDAPESLPTKKTVEELMALEAQKTADEFESHKLSAIDGINSVLAKQTPVDNTNDFGLGGQLDRIRPIAFPEFVTKQQAFRFAGWLILMAEMLPDESGNHTLEEIIEAIKNPQ